jgi:hypothetical protein
MVATRKGLPKPDSRNLEVLCGVALLRRRSMARKIIRVARPAKSDAERILDVRRRVSEYIASVAVPRPKKRRRSPNRVVTLVLK